MSRILVVEDEVRIARFIAGGLRASGYAVDVVGTAREAMESVLAHPPDLLVLDVGLPDRDGLELLRDLRERGETMPVMLLTARAAVEDRVRGLDRGADDYLTKPFAMDELLARLRVRLRPSATASVGSIAVGDLRLDLRSRRAVTPELGEVELSAREFALLDDLMRHAGMVRTREQLLDRVWGFDFDPGSNVVEVYVSYLRRKVGAARIQTVRGAGYRVIPVPEPAGSP